MNDLNEKLKGFRGQLVLWIAVLLSTIDIVREAIVQFSAMIGPQLDETGAVAALIGTAVSVKLLITDTLKRLRGELYK